MASHTLVKNYLAQWMQMGKTVSLSTEGEEVSIWKILQDEKYSSLFNEFWDEISTTKAHTAYLTGTDQTIGDLLSNRWEIIACARCNLLLPSIDMGPRVPVCCPCDDLPNHPNLDLVMPHLPVKLLSHLDDLCDRLAQKSTEAGQELGEMPTDTDEIYTSVEEQSQALHDLRQSILKLVKVQTTD
jgi:CHAD domain-containing protein